MNIAAFAVIQHQEAEHWDDQIGGLAGLGNRAPVLAWAITISMLALAGVPGTVGFIGKFRLIQALVDGGYGWLAIVLVIGAMISLGYYLRVVAAVWMSPEGARAKASVSSTVAPIAGGSQEADKLPYPEIAVVAGLFAAATIFFGIIPGPLFHFAAHAGAALSGLF
jgi:NADH-quinone oxidoreductase subunit N